MKVLWSVLASIYHLGCAGVTRSNLGRAVFAKQQSAQRAAHCLGVSLDDLSRAVFQVTGYLLSILSTIDNIYAVFQGQVSSGTLNRNANKKKDEAAVTDGAESLQGLVVGLYSEVFHVLVALINRAIATPAHTAASIVVVDTPGFQNPATCGRPSGKLQL